MQYETAVRRRFAFLDDALPDQQTLATGAPVRRAAATVARQSDA